MGNWHKVIGIDLGTTFSAVAAYNFDKQDVRIIPNRQNEPTTPSVVYFPKAGQVSVGRAAKERLARDPGGVIIEVKRLMGERDPSGAKATVRTASQTYEPEFISAFILKEMKACAERVIGEPVHDAVITVPAYFKESQKNATKEAARIARLNPLLIINEPTAAAIAYAVEAGDKQTFIVYDLGGGTFDVSIVRANNERSFDVLGTGGDPHLGGGDIDQSIVDWALGRMRQQFGRDFSKDERLAGRLRLEAERVKINLCNENAGQEFALDNVTAEIPEISFRLELEEFERMILPLLERTLKAVDVALESARRQYEMTLDDIEAFILVGGSSKIPAVQSLLRERFHKPVKSDLNPDEVVAIGAGWMGKNYSPSLGPEIHDGTERKIDTAAKTFADHRDVKDVVSHTLGVGLKDDVYDSLIPKDTVIPYRMVRDGYTTSEDNQTNIFVPVYQGEDPKGSLNTLLGQVTIDGLAPEPKGTHRFSITFGLDANGIFQGEIKHQQTGSVTDVQLDRGQGQMTEKRRIALSEIVTQGDVPVSDSGGGGAVRPQPSGRTSNPVDALIRQAVEVIQRLPPNRQQEINDMLGRLTRARAANDENEQAALVAQVTMFIMRNQP